MKLFPRGVTQTTKVRGGFFGVAESHCLGVNQSAPWAGSVTPFHRQGGEVKFISNFPYNIEQTG